ncbi:MAG: lactate utilization protein [Spirochaetes bacterium]|nr:lactate utilization protein [Spirochaetota bacterium]
MRDFSKVPSKEAITRTQKALMQNGIETIVVPNRAEALKTVLSLLPEKAEVFTMTSITLDEAGITKEVNDSGRYRSVRNALYALDPKTQAREQRKLGAAPDYAIGSVHAVTETGIVLVASFTGSQIPAYAYGAGTLIWVVGAQKIVSSLEEGLKRIQQYVLPKESARARKAYNLPDSFNSYPSKILLFEKEIQPGRVKLILVEEPLGF